MTDENKQLLKRMVAKTFTENSGGALTLGYLRYEALRKLSAGAYISLCRRNIKGENFDEMVDGLVLQTFKP